MFYRRLFNVPTGGFTRSFHELDRMKRQMDNLFDALSVRNFPRPFAGVFPLTNLTEDKNNYYLRAELPGIKGDELDIQVEKNRISITGERKKESEGENVKYHRRERETGKFSRSINLPGEIDGDKVEAGLVSGILTITIPKAEAVKPRQITIH